MIGVLLGVMQKNVGRVSKQLSPNAISVSQISSFCFNISVDINSVNRGSTLPYPTPLSRASAAITTIAATLQVLCFLSIYVTFYVVTCEFLDKLSFGM